VRPAAALAETGGRHGSARGRRTGRPARGAAGTRQEGRGE
jgi:hypothetical protein